MQWIVAYPLWLWAVPLIAAAGVGLWFAWRRIVRKRLERFVAPRHFAEAMPSVNWRVRAVQFAVTVIVIMLLAVALARPMRGPTGENAESKGVDFVLALDVSKSMWVEDVAPNRLAAVKKQLGELIKTMHGDRMGLVLFAGDAMVQAPVTFDYTALNHVLQQSGPKSISYGGTNIPKAIERATDLLKNAEPRSRILVIVTDGENLEGDAVGAVRQARMTDGLTIFTVGVGTTAGGRVPMADYSQGPPPNNRQKAYVRNEYGVGVTSRLDPRSLRLLAEAGGGRYFELKPDTNVFEDLHQQSLLPLARKSQKIDLKEYQDWFQLPLGLAILLITAGPLLALVKSRPAVAGTGVEVVMPETLSKPTGPRTFIRVRRPAAVSALLLAISATSVFATPMDDAEKLLASKKSDEAVQLMRKAVEQDEKNPYLFYNYALTLYRAGKHEEAIAAFTALRQTTDLAPLQEMAAVQMGNAQVRLGDELKKGGKLPGAILSLERALSHYDETPSNKAGKDVKNNRQIAAVRLEKFLLEAGSNYRSAADAKVSDPKEEEQPLRSALQAYERVTEINPKNTDAAKTAQELRERLAQNLSKQAKGLTDQADALAQKNEQPTTKPATKDKHEKKQEDPMPKLEAAVAKLDDALTHTPESKPIQEQKQDVQNKMSDLHTKAAEKQMAKPMEKPKLDDPDQKNLTEAKGKLEQAMALNPENKKAEDLHKQASEKLEQSHVERGQEALAAADKPQGKPETKLAQLQKAADQFQKALQNNEKSEPAKKGLEEANSKLPEAFAAAGDAEAAKAKDAMAGNPTPGKPAKPAAPGKPSSQDMQKAIGFLEKANQNYGMALSMAPQNADLQKRADAIADLLAGARDELDQQQREGLPTPGMETPIANSGEDAANTQRTMMPMSDLAGKAKPNSGDNFWDKQKRDW